MLTPSFSSSLLPSLLTCSNSLPPSLPDPREQPTTGVTRLLLLPLLGELLRPSQANQSRVNHRDSRTPLTQPNRSTSLCSDRADRRAGTVIIVIHMTLFLQRSHPLFLLHLCGALRSSSHQPLLISMRISSPRSTVG